MGICFLRGRGVSVRTIRPKIFDKGPLEEKCAFEHSYVIIWTVKAELRGNQSIETFISNGKVATLGGMSSDGLIRLLLRGRQGRVAWVANFLRCQFCDYITVIQRTACILHIYLATGRSVLTTQQNVNCYLWW